MATKSALSPTESLKQHLDKLAGVVNHRTSWLDENFSGGPSYTMPNDDGVLAYRYTAITYAGQAECKLKAEKLQAKLSHKGYNLRVNSHYTTPLRRDVSPYWKVEVFIPRHMVLK